MSSRRPFLTAEVACAQVTADLVVIDEALARLRETSTDLVSNAFRIDVVDRLETHLRINRGVSYRMSPNSSTHPTVTTDPSHVLGPSCATCWPADCTWCPPRLGGGSRSQPASPRAAP